MSLGEHILDAQGILVSMYVWYPIWAPGNEDPTIFIYYVNSYLDSKGRVTFWSYRGHFETLICSICISSTFNPGAPDPQTPDALIP